MDAQSVILVTEGEHDVPFVASASEAVIAIDRCVFCDDFHNSEGEQGTTANGSCGRI